jgi:hypothetical protein
VEPEHKEPHQHFQEVAAIFLLELSLFPEAHWSELDSQWERILLSYEKHVTLADKELLTEIT